MNFELAELLAGRWLMQPSDFRSVVLPMVQRVEKATALDIKGAQEAYASRDPGPLIVADIAVIRISGPIVYKSSWFSMFFGATAIEDLQYQFRAAMGDPAVKTIVFQVNSPGGVVDMCPEFADEIFNARGQGKPIIGTADLLAASAAYWLLSQVDTIYATQSSQLGSIGVYCEHDSIAGMLKQIGVEITLIAHGENKTLGNPYEPLSDAARAEFQARVDEIGDWFDTAVARGRGVKKSVVLETFGQGKVFRGKQAIALGLADKQGTIGAVLSRLTKGRVTTATARAMFAVPISPPIVAAGDEDEDGCSTCSPDCPCDNDDCPVDCPDCDEDCACLTSGGAKAAAPGTCDGCAHPAHPGERCRSEAAMGADCACDRSTASPASASDDEIAIRIARGEF
jgi:signal peptide peptidase SppA